MRNYIKSEFYRILHTTEIYYITGVLALLSVLLNIGICVVKTRYSTSSFSYSCLVASPTIFACTGAVIAYFLYEGSKKNGSLKNAVSNGISRIKIFAGRCIVSTAVSTLIMTTTLAAWIISAELLLEKTGPVKLSDLLLEIPAVYLISVGCVISAVLCIDYFDKNITGILVWGSVWVFIPELLLFAGMRFKFLYDLSLWLPYNFFKVTNGQYVNTQECITAWDTSGGMLRCIVSGAAGTLIFFLAGVFSLKKKDL